MVWFRIYIHFVIIAYVLHSAKGQVEAKFGHPVSPHPKTQKIQTILQVWICLRSIWQECQSLKITFEELGEVDIQEIRELLDKAEPSNVADDG